MTLPSCRKRLSCGVRLWSFCMIVLMQKLRKRMKKRNRKKKQRSLPGAGRRGRAELGGAPGCGSRCVPLLVRGTLRPLCPLLASPAAGVNEFVIPDGYERAGLKFLTLPSYVSKSSPSSLLPRAGTTSTLVPTASIAGPWLSPLLRLFGEGSTLGSSRTIHR